MSASDLLPWLLDSDPAIRWQVLRDLTDAPPAEVEAERARVATEGWGARLLALQAPDGTWGGGLYQPKWVSTTYTLLQLLDYGAPRSEATLHAADVLVDRGFRPSDGGFNFGGLRVMTASRRGGSETCITGMVLNMGVSFGSASPYLEPAVEHLIRVQLPDGGWNCAAPPDHHGSFNTTILALEALLAWERARGSTPDVLEARARAHEFLLVHRLFRSHRSGEVAKQAFLNLAFPPRWHYDILRALDYFCDADLPRDERLSDAIEVLRSRRRSDGRWPAAHRWPATEHFRMEAPREPSRWNTLRALRVLRWWEAVPGQS